MTGPAIAGREVMDNMIVYLDEAAHALAILPSLLPAGQVRGPVRWIVVGCAPRVTHHVSKWVTHSARKNWRDKWADKVFAQVLPVLQGPGDEVVTQIASGPLCDLTDALMRQYGPGRVLDARRPKLGNALQPVTRQPAAQGQSLWACAAMMAGSGMLLAMD
ncbi:MAG: hypothetical protein ACT6Q9_03690 [Polaromonas sp.]|uniref:hypothetical protein n=1 Tax=Polaromonas sp. TaxID=1869339 RepID=UPI0040374727